jgi:hypothetical protein
MKIEIEDNKYIELDEQPRLFFYGSDQKMQQKLIRSLKRFSTKKVLNPLEEVVYGENGIEIYRNDQLLNPKSIDMYFLQDSSSIFSEIDFTKNSLMGNYLKILSEEIEVSVQLEEIKNHMLQMENIFNKKISGISNNVSLNLRDLTFEDLLKNHLFLSFSDKKHEYPLEMLDSNELIDEYTQLLSSRIAHGPKETWVVLINPESFLSPENVAILLKRLGEISDETNVLRTIIIANRAIDTYYSTADVPCTIVLADDAFQMPEFDDFRRDIENHYPNQITLSDEELCQSFYNVVSDIGINAMNVGIRSSDMVLLKVIDEILGFTDLSFTVRSDNISEAEKSYLLNKN